MQHTPAHVVTAIQTVAAYIKEASYGSVIIAPTGGASFHIRNVLDEKADLFKEIGRLEYALSSARAERSSGLGAHKRLLDKAKELRATAEARAAALKRQGQLLARIEALARAGDARAVVEAIVRAHEETRK